MTIGVGRRIVPGEGGPSGWRRGPDGADALVLQHPDIGTVDPLDMWHVIDVLLRDPGRPDIGRLGHMTVGVDYQIRYGHLFSPGAWWLSVT